MKRHSSKPDKIDSSEGPQNGGKSAESQPKTSSPPAELLQRSIGNQAVQQLSENGDLQAKLEGGRSRDEREREAERVADQTVEVSRAPTPAVASKHPAQDHLQRAEAELGSAPAEREFDRETMSIHGGGQRLPESVRSFFEPHFSRDFSEVRIHTNSRADEMARGVKAKAFTYGRDLVFRSGAYRPETKEGKRLLAHELTHVVQQENTPVNRIQRQSQSKEKEQFEITEFDFKKGEQKATKKTSGGKVDIHYDPAKKVFRCTFHLDWTFPLSWNDERKKKYRQKFAAVIKKHWSEKYTLAEYSGEEKGATPTGRQAKVVIDFATFSMPKEYTGLSSLTEKTEWLGKHDDVRQRRYRAFKMKVLPGNEQDSVKAGKEVTLDSNSLTADEIQVEKYRNYGKPEKITNHTMQDRMNPPYSHYKEADVPLRLPEKGTTYEQTSAAHEFGHMLGLDDEYIIDEEDFQQLPKQEQKKRLAARNKATGRIMNIGSKVTQDAYRPFAQWLSSLTQSEWRVR